MRTRSDVSIYVRRNTNAERPFHTTCRPRTRDLSPRPLQCAIQTATAGAGDYRAGLAAAAVPAAPRVERGHGSIQRKYAAGGVEQRGAGGGGGRVGGADRRAV